jgi:hypothetical protein
VIGTQIHADNPDFKSTELPDAFIRIFYRVYNKQGYGLLEKVYDLFRKNVPPTFSVNLRGVSPL